MSKNKIFRTILPVILIFCLFAILTFPLMFHFATYIPGFFSTDEPFGILWASWRTKFSISNGLPLIHTTLIAYPFGVNAYASGLFYNLWTIIFITVSFLTNHVITYNLHILVNFMLCAVFTYYLVRRLTGNSIAALFSGVVFAFCPYQFVRSWQHFGLTFSEWIPLSILAAVILKENPSRRNFLLFSLSIFLILSFDLVVMYLTFVALAVFFIYNLFYNWRVKFTKGKALFASDLKYMKSAFLSGLLGFTLMLPQLFGIIRNRIMLSSSTPAAAYNYFHRPFEDLFFQSARLLSYILPSAFHPVLGKFTESLVGNSLYGTSFTEHTLYLGWTGIILALIAFRRWKRNRKNPQTGEDFYIGFFLLLALTAWLFSQPPWWKIGPVKVFMPSYFMYKLLPMFRAYTRFGIVLMFAVVVLAGFGFKYVLEGLKARRAKIATAVLVFGLALFEFWNYPPFKVIDVSKVPQVYYWLKDQPQDIVIAEYPSDAHYTSEKYRFYQITHHKKIINGTLLGTHANEVARTMMALSDAQTAGKLKWLGVKYVLVHHDDYLKTDLIEDRQELENIPRNPGLKFIRSFAPEDCPRKDIMCTQRSGKIDVYEVIAEPLEPAIEAEDGNT